MRSRSVIQHIDDVEIPVIEITDGWSAESCTTKEQCDDAFAYLMSACAGIEYQIDMEFTKPKEQQDAPWLAKAKCALKYKKAALQIVQNRKALISETEKRVWQERQDRHLLTYIRSVVPDHQFLEWVRASNVADPGQEKI